MSVPLVAGTPAFDDAVHDYLKRHPEAVAEALQSFQEKQEQARDAAAQAAIGTETDKLYHDAASPVVGNPNGKETLVEFFDYSCHYCKQIHPDLQTLLKDDHDLKIIYKDFPILGPGSVLAAKAALAAKMQDKYVPMHDALLDFKGQFDDTAIQQIASNVGLDYTKLKTDMDSPAVSQQISDNMALADKLNIHGTPSMIINHQFVGGALPLDELKAKLAQNKDG
jgi:protein-disulfide isomerase